MTNILQTLVVAATSIIVAAASGFALAGYDSVSTAAVAESPQSSVNRPVEAGLAELTSRIEQLEARVGGQSADSAFAGRNRSFRPTGPMQ